MGEVLRHATRQGGDRDADPAGQVSEVTKLPFDTPLGPVLPAAMYLAVCAWPDSRPQRSRLVEALLHAGARCAGYRHPGPDLRVLQRRVDRGGERLIKAFQAAEVAQLATVPAEFEIPVTFVHPNRYAIGRYEPGVMSVALPSLPAVGQGSKPSIKRLQALAAGGWEAPADPRDLADGDREFRRDIWRRFLPALPYIVPLKLHVGAGEIDLISLVRDPSWLDEALRRAEFWREKLSTLDNVPAEFIRLARA